MNVELVYMYSESKLFATVEMWLDLRPTFPENIDAVTAQLVGTKSYRVSFGFESARCARWSSRIHVLSHLTSIKLPLLFEPPKAASTSHDAPATISYNSPRSARIMSCMEQTH